MPVVSVGEAGFARLVGRSGATVSVDGARVHLQGGDHAPPPSSSSPSPSPSPSPLSLSLLDAATEAAAANAAAANAAAANAAAAAANAAAAAAEADAAEAAATEAAVEATSEAHAGLMLSAADQAMLDGAHGRAAKVAMRIVARAASLQHATELVDITQAHIDGCIYVGPASLRFAQQMLALGGATHPLHPLHTLTTHPYHAPLPHTPTPPLSTTPYHTRDSPPLTTPPCYQVAPCACRRRSMPSPSTSGDGASSECLCRSVS